MLDQSKIFKLVADEFSRENIPCALVGGFAINALGISRMTEDVDFLIDQNDVKKAMAILTKEGYKPFAEHENFARFRSNDGNSIDVDLIFVDSGTLHEIIQKGKTVSIGSKKFVVPSPTHLLAMKLHALKSNFENRQFKDLLDVIMLLKKENLNPSETPFRDLCMKYGSEEIYRKVVNFYGQS